MSKVHRSGAVLIKDKKALVERSQGKNFFIPPGGRIEKGETPEQALVRELMEELKIKVQEPDLMKLKTFYKTAGGQEDYDVQMDMFYVTKWAGEITPNSEVEEIKWIDSTPDQNLNIGSIFKEEILPILKEQNLID